MTVPISSLIVERADDVLVLTINRPDKGNALDNQTVGAMLAVLEGLAADPAGARAVLLRSEGKHFCTGADITGAGSSGSGTRPTTGHLVRGLEHGPHRLIQTLWECRLPVVAELTGRASGLGLHVALACDFAIAAESATFAEPFSQRGFSVDSGGSWLLPRLIGLTRAKQLLYLAEPINAPTAVAWGLISEVVPDNEVGARSAELAAQLANGPTFSLGTTKRLLHRHLTTDIGDALTDEAAAVELTVRSDDFKEGMRAFVEKRRPGFTGQ